MNYLREQLERKASGVIHVSEYQDSEPTLQFKDFIIDKISNQDSDFAELIQQNPNKTFSFGDKFFAPLIDNNILVCIPLDSANIELKLQKILTGVQQYYSFIYRTNTTDGRIQLFRYFLTIN